VLAHEMGHVVHRHGLRQLLQGSVVTVLAVVILGDASSLAAIMPATLLELGYSRRFEREADDYTLEVLARRGVPAERFADILARLEQEHRTREGHEDAAKGGENWSYYLSTHPPTAERLARFGR